MFVQQNNMKKKTISNVSNLRIFYEKNVPFKSPYKIYANTKQIIQVQKIIFKAFQMQPYTRRNTREFHISGA